MVIYALLSSKYYVSHLCTFVVKSARVPGWGEIDPSSELAPVHILSGADVLTSSSQLFSYRTGYSVSLLVIKDSQDLLDCH